MARTCLMRIQPQAMNKSRRHMQMICGDSPEVQTSSLCFDHRVLMIMNRASTTSEVVHCIVCRPGVSKAQVAHVLARHKPKAARVRALTAQTRMPWGVAERQRARSPPSRPTILHLLAFSPWADKTRFLPLWTTASYEQ